MDGYRLSLQWNDSYAFRDYPPLTKYQRIHQQLLPDMSGQSRPGVQRCERCGDLTDKWAEPLSSLVIKVRHYDISATYDGIVVVSDTFKRAYDETNLAGLVFRALPLDPSFHNIQPVKRVSFDYERRKTQFLKQCSLCGHWESVVGATPVFLKSGGVIGDREFVGTDLEFGSFDGKCPLILCGPEVARAFREFKLKGAEVCEFVTEKQKAAMEKQSGFPK
jgi:hypothetical protein